MRQEQVNYYLLIMILTPRQRSRIFVVVGCDGHTFQLARLTKKVNCYKTTFQKNF
jgi:hypothetical protein